MSSPVPLLLLDLVQGFFGRGPFLGAGPGPRNLPSRPLQGISAGPGPRGKIGPRPNVVGTSSKRELDLVQGVSVCQKHPLCHTSSFRTTCSPRCMYTWNAARGRFRVHTPGRCATGDCLPGCMYSWNAVRGRFRVHTPGRCATGACSPRCMYSWNAARGRFRVHTPGRCAAGACLPGCMYTRNAARGRFRVHTPEGCAAGACLPGCMYTRNAARGRFRVHTPPQGGAATREKKRPVEIDRTFLHDWSPGNGYLSLNSRRPPERRSA